MLKKVLNIIIIYYCLIYYYFDAFKYYNNIHITIITPFAIQVSSSSICYDHYNRTTIASSVIIMYTHIRVYLRLLYILYFSISQRVFRNFTLSKC